MLKPRGILAVVELVFDPHFQTRRTVTDLAVAVGFVERGFGETGWPTLFTSRNLLANNIIDGDREGAAG